MAFDSTAAYYVGELSVEVDRLWPVRPQQDLSSSTGGMDCRTLATPRRTLGPSLWRCFGNLGKVHGTLTRVARCRPLRLLPGCPNVADSSYVTLPFQGLCLLARLAERELGAKGLHRLWAHRDTRSIAVTSLGARTSLGETPRAESYRLPSILALEAAD